MSVDATKWAWLQQIKSSHKLVLLALADRAGEDNECWPSVSRLEKDTGLDRKTIMSAIQSMENDGILTVFRIQGAGNKYKLMGVDNRETNTKNGTSLNGRTSAKKGTASSTKIGTSTGIGTSTRNGTTPVPKTGQGSTKNGTTTSTKNGIQNLKEEPINNLKGNLKDIAILAEFGIGQDLAKDFITHRKKHKAAISKTVLNGFQRESDIAGISINDAIRISIERGWRGFKAEWIKNSQQPLAQNYRSNPAARTANNIAVLQDFIDGN